MASHPPFPKSDTSWDDDGTQSPLTGLGTLRPYVGVTPEIRQEGPGRRAPRRSQWGWLGFLSGIVLSLVTAVSFVAWQRSSPAPVAQSTPPPRLLNGDALPAVGEHGLHRRAESGDHPALTKLKERAPSSRTPTDVLALARGAEALARVDAREFSEKLAARKPTSLTDSDLAEFFALAGNERTFRSALVGMTKSQSSLGPDLIYQATRRFRFQKDVAGFALSLLLTPEVYKYASPALTVVIDAEILSECSAVIDLVERAREDGDARAVRHMAKFAEKGGCGDDGHADCYPCLRHDRALVDALRAAQDRPAPRY